MNRELQAWQEAFFPQPTVLDGKLCIVVRVPSSLSVEFAATITNMAAGMAGGEATSYLLVPFKPVTRFGRFVRLLMGNFKHFTQVV